MSKTVNAQRIEFTMNNEKYRIDRYKNRAVLVFKEIDGVYDFVSAKRVIRTKLNEIDSVKYALDATKELNTRYLGNKLAKLLSA